MKRTTLLLCGLAAAILSGAAIAGPYIGADYQFIAPFITPAQVGVTPQHFSGGNVHAGWRQGHMAAEVGFLMGGGDEGTNRFNLSGPSVDLFAFAPFARSGAEIFATAGALDLTATNRNGAAQLYSDTSWAWRAGAGLQWGRPTGTTARMMVRYEDFAFGNRATGGVTFSAGLNFPIGGR